MSSNAPLTFISDEVSQDLETVIRFAQRHHLRGFELRSMFGRAFKDLTSTDVARIAERARAEDLEVFGCAPPVFKCDLEDASAGALHREIFERALATASQLRCRLLRIFTFNRPPRPLAAGLISRVAERIAPLLEAGRRAGITVAVENECSCTIANAGEIQALLSEFAPGDVSLIWDPCNVLYLPEAPVTADLDPAPFAAAIKHVHVKDAARKNANPSAQPAEARIVGEGQVDWPTHLRRLSALGYRGMYSLETHWRRHALDAAALHLPAGDAFSAGGEEASEICLSQLRVLLAKTSS